MKVVEGDLLALADAGQFDLIIHGANCFHAMGSGIAAQIAKRWPEVRAVDRRTVYASAVKLGGYSLADVRRSDGGQLWVVNAYTQFRPGPDARLEAIEDALNEVANDFGRGVRIGYPMIGCGIGGLSWEDVAPIFDSAFLGRDHTLVVYGGTK